MIHEPPQDFCDAVDAYAEENRRKWGQHEAEERQREEAKERELDRQYEEAMHPDTPAGGAARKAEKLLAKAAATDEPERTAFAAKALDLIHNHKLVVVVTVR